MPKGFKRDYAFTKTLCFSDERSFISLSGHEVLYGKDKTYKRSTICERAKGKCQVCGKDAPLEGEDGYRGEWHHIETAIGKRCDCLHNASWRCGRFVGDCHSKEHAKRAPRWTPKQA